MSGRIFAPNCGGGCDDGCGGGCGGIPIIGANTEPEVLYNPGMYVMSKLTGQKLMVLKRGQNEEGDVMYVVRTGAYEMVQMFEFELEALVE